MCERGECEFVEDVAAKLPLEIICEMIGLPESDWQRMFELSNTMIGFDDPEYQATPEAGAVAAAEIYMYCNDIAADRRANPRDDLMTALVQAELDGDRLDDLELNLFFVTLVVAGNETTRNLINHGTLALIEHPDQAQRLRDDPEPLSRARSRRCCGGARRSTTSAAPPPATPCSAARPSRRATRWSSTTWPPTAIPAVFDDPYRFDVGRHPNDHVAFGGGGVHFCLGANLARSEIRAITRQVVERMPDLALAGPVRRLRSDFVNGIKEMPVRFTPTPRLTPA